MEKIKVTVVHLQLDDDEISGYGALVKDIPPLNFLGFRESIGIVVRRSGKHTRIIPYSWIEQVLDRPDGGYLKYTASYASGRKITKEIGPIPKEILENILLPLYEHENFSQKVEMVLSFVIVALRNEEDAKKGVDVKKETESDDLKSAFEEFRGNKIDKIKSLRDQDFGKAAEFREKEKEAANAFRKCLTIMIPEQNLNEAAEYFLDNYQKLLEAMTVAAEGI